MRRGPSDAMEMVLGAHVTEERPLPRDHPRLELPVTPSPYSALFRRKDLWIRNVKEITNRARPWPGSGGKQKQLLGRKEREDKRKKEESEREAEGAEKEEGEGEEEGKEEGQRERVDEQVLSGAGIFHWTLSWEFSQSLWERGSGRPKMTPVKSVNRCIFLVCSCKPLLHLHTT